MSYPLWPETFALLKQERSDDADRVLLPRDGLPFKTEVIGENGKLKKTDVGRLAINRLTKKTGVSFTLKTTSGSLLRGQREYQGQESMFLGPADRSIAHRNDTKAPRQLLTEAIAWVGRELGITADEAAGSFNEWP